MTAERIHDLLKRQPFAPFALTLTTGERFVVRHAENLIVGKRVCYYPIFDGEFVDRMVHISIPHIVKLEPFDGSSNSEQN